MLPLKFKGDKKVVAQVANFEDAFQDLITDDQSTREGLRSAATSGEKK